SKQEKKSRGKNYLLVIGINKYRHFPHLNNAVRDAKTIRDILLEHYQFDEQDTISLFDQDATREGILGKLYDLEDLVTPADNLLIYFAGHGVMNRQETEGFWVPVEALNKRAHYIPNDRIRAMLKNIKSHHTYLLIDSCFAGTMILRKIDSHVNLVDQFPSRRVLTSGRKQVVSDGVNGEHSPFAHCIIEYLMRYLGSPIYAKDLESHVKKSLPRNSTQTPSADFIFDAGDQGGQFVFLPRRILENVDPGEKMAFDLAKKLGILALKFFIKEYPNSRYVPEAELEIQRISDVKEITESTIKVFSPEINISPKDLSNGPIEMVFVEGGTFMMGSDDGNDNEKPVHKVKLSSFYIGKYLVTQRQWEEVMGENPSSFKNCPDCPVESVSWDDVQKFLQKINQKYPGLNYRLPTEAEWEFAVRGGNQSRNHLYSGSDNLDEVGWFDENSKKSKGWLQKMVYGENKNRSTRPVGNKNPNELGIYDMSGNVWEWCKDRYGESYYQTCLKQGAIENPTGPGEGDYRVIRGGSWNYPSGSCRSTYRSNFGPVSRVNRVGFRVVVSLNQ
ncbi:MAG: SUMF1/EgtB/PvdO family nonheme iron enzyme, partial [Bacteroidetes bacterium]|nr:SUMF1/EgtB/PvdO family nonheme iron enzyme [Bacteroidota bacterium]